MMEVMEDMALDYVKVGALLLKLRKERGLTQRQVADQMHLSDKTISKWERGIGCPDVSLLSGLSEIFEVDVAKILEGDLNPNPMDNGNLKRMQFYVCSNCGNLITGTGQVSISCCGRKLVPRVLRRADQAHAARIEASEGEYFITFDHEMTKAHFISFVAYVTSDKMHLVKFYPEQTVELRLPKMAGGKLETGSGILYAYCSRHGLFQMSGTVIELRE